MPSRSRMQIEPWWTESTGAIGYLVLDRVTRTCALIDCAREVSTTPAAQELAARIVARVRQLGAELAWLLQTRMRADQLAAAAELLRQLGGRLGAGAADATAVQTWGDADGGTAVGAGCGACHHYADGEVFGLGGLEVRVLHTPGHASDGVTYVVSDGPGGGADMAAFVGDLLCMPDRGTACCDPAGGDPRRLFRSINRVLSLPPATRIYVSHDCPPATRDFEFVSTVAEQRRSNIHVRDGIGEAAFVTLRCRLDTRVH
ncbi:MAG: MBL fold metallo-hydrolase [Burkholderiales bacterium]|nr:MBL fold metallo-hydrolase [Burkholderiales bacterium]